MFSQDCLHTFSFDSVCSLSVLVCGLCGSTREAPSDFVVGVLKSRIWICSGDDMLLTVTPKLLHVPELVTCLEEVSRTVSPFTPWAMYMQGGLNHMRNATVPCV